MRSLIESIPASVVALTESLRRALCDPYFVKRHRLRYQYFTRERQLTFPVVMLFILQKSAKSIQRHLHELFELIAGETSRSSFACFACFAVNNPSPWENSLISA